MTFIFGRKVANHFTQIDSNQTEHHMTSTTTTTTSTSDTSGTTSSSGGGGGAGASATADPVSLHTNLLALTEEKLRTFSDEYAADNSTDGAALVEKVERLYHTLIAMNPEDMSQEQYNNIISTHDELSFQSIRSSRNVTPKKKSRRREEMVVKCIDCGWDVINGACSNPRCARMQSSGELRDGKTKAKDSASSRIQEFQSLLDILLAITSIHCSFTTPLLDPSNQRYYNSTIHDAETGPRVRQWLEENPTATPVNIVENYLADLGYNVKALKTTPPIVIDQETMREAMKIAGLRNVYIYANALRYYLTGYRPKPYSPEDRELFQRYYARTVNAYYKEMASTDTRVTKKGHVKRSNFWNIQAYIKLILSSSNRLRLGHTDFFDSLHTQSPSTETCHCEVWERMMQQENWKFE
jgi:hypothetical protein